MWKVLIFSIIYLFCVYSDNYYDLLLPNNEILIGSITECIKKITLQTLRFKPTVVIDTQYFENKTKCSIFTAETTKTLMENNITIVLVTDRSNIDLVNNIIFIEDHVFKTNYSLNALMLIYFETCEDIILFDRTINEYVKKLILVAEPFSYKCIEKIRQIIDIDQYDITFMLPHEIYEDQIKIFTFINKIDENKCVEVNNGPTEINTCAYGTLKNKVLFPSKNPTNLRQCPFRVGMATLYPLSRIKNKDSLQMYDHINGTVGSDMELMKIIGEVFNASLHIYYIYRNEENPTGDYNFLKYLLNGSLDVCAGGLYRIYGDIVAYSGIYARQAVIWIYYAERVDRSWEVLIMKVNGLYYFIIFYICYSLIWYIIRLYDNDTVSLRDTLLYGWGALVGATSLQDPRSLKQRILNLVYLVMSIYWSAYISIEMYLFLTIRPPPQMFTTNDDIMESGRIPYLKSSSKYFVEDKKYLEYANKSAECVSFQDCAEKTLANNGLTILLNGYFYAFQAATTVDGEARILRTTENVLTVYHEMLIRKDSPIVSKFQRIIRSLFEAGITERKYNEAIGVLIMAKANVANSNMIMNSYSCQAGCTITFRQIAGAFYCWLLGCILSCILFAVEMCKKRERNEVIL